MTLLGRPAPCPCGSGATWQTCCAELVAGTRRAATAEALMRSRYAAFVVGDADHLWRTWHPRTRPATVELDSGVTWVGLEVVGTTLGGPDDAVGVVTFRAHHRTPAGPGVLAETSRFERRGGRWVYVAGDPAS